MRDAHNKRKIAAILEQKPARPKVLAGTGSAAALGRA